MSWLATPLRATSRNGVLWAAVPTVLASVCVPINCSTRAEGRWWRANCLELQPHTPIPKAPSSMAMPGTDFSAGGVTDTLWQAWVWKGRKKWRVTCDQRNSLVLCEYKGRPGNQSSRKIAQTPSQIFLILHVVYMWMQTSFRGQHASQPFLSASNERAKYARLSRRPVYSSHQSHRD